MELKYKVGCDPEFSILNDGQRIHADRCIMGLFKDDPRLRGDTLETEGGEFGCDGCVSTGELRPKPALEPAEVAANIRTCVKSFMDKAPQLELSTLSLWAPVGGHIHLELPPGDWSEDKLASVHKRLMSYYLPILMGEHKTNLAIRQKHYGQITDYRCDGGASRRTLEVRCPSAEWLTSETTAKATLAYMTMVWHEVWDHPENLDKRLLLKTQQQETALQDLAISEFDSVTRALMRDISKSVRKFSLYPKFRQEADFILRPDRVLAEKKRHNFTLNSGWGFGTRKTGTNNKKKFLKAPALVDGRAEGMGIGHNGDLNTGILCDEMRARALGGFKFKNAYYFYGLKEGLDGHLVSSDSAVWLSQPVGTAEEAERIRETARRMDQKAFDRCGGEKKVKLDFKTSKITKEEKRVFAIGVPFKERAAKNFRPTLELVWALEKGKVEPEGTKILPKGECASLPTGLSVDAEEGGAFDRDWDSQGRSYSSQAVEEVIDEQARREREEGRAGLMSKAARFHDLLMACPAIETPEGTRALVALDPTHGSVVTFLPEYGGTLSTMDWVPDGLVGFRQEDTGRIPSEGGRSIMYMVGGTVAIAQLRLPAMARVSILDAQGGLTGLSIMPMVGEDVASLLQRGRRAMELHDSTGEDEEEEEEEDFKINHDGNLCAE